MSFLFLINILYIYKLSWLKYIYFRFYYFIITILLFFYTMHLIYQY